VIFAEPGRWWTWSRYSRLAVLLTVPHVLIAGTFGTLILSELSTANGPTRLAFVVYSATALSAHLFREGLHGLGRHRTSIAIDVVAATAQLALIAGAYAVGVLSPPTALYIGSLCFAGAIAAQSFIGRRADMQGRQAPRVTVREWWREAGNLLEFSRFALLAALGQSFVVNGDRLVLGATGTSNQVGIYSAAASLASLTWVAPVALTALLTRRTAELGTLEAWRRMRLPVLVLTCVLALGVALTGWFAVPILLGDQFESARGLLPILCAAAVPYASYHFDSAACAGLRDLRTGALAALLGCLSLVGAASLGYYAIGTRGVACGVLFTYVLMAVTARLGLRQSVARRDREADAYLADASPAKKANRQHVL
jgi:O-antigen/teichoic acid export membrane protein